MPFGGFDDDLGLQVYGVGMRSLASGLLIVGLLVTANWTAEAKPQQVQSAAANKSPLVFGIFPRRDALKTISLFGPLRDYLSSVLDRPIELQTSANFDDFNKRLRRGDFDIAHLNQYQYVTFRDRYGYKAFAQNEEFGQEDITGSIFTHVNSGVTSLEDLKGKVILFGGNETAMMSYVYPTVLLARAGLPPGSYTPRFATSPPNALIASILNKSGAAAVGTPVVRLPLVKSRINTEDVRQVYQSSPMPQLVWAFHPRIKSSDKAAIAKAMTQLEQTAAGRTVLKAALLTGINSSQDSDFDPVRAIIREYQTIKAAAKIAEPAS